MSFIFSHFNFSKLRLSLIGDFSNLFSIYRKKNSTRFFNKIEFRNEMVYKSAVLKDYQNLINGEYD